VEDTSRLWVTIPVPEDAGVRLRPGTTADIRFDALRARGFVGEVTHVNAAADPRSRQFLVRIGMENRDGAVKPGMFGRVSLVVANGGAARSCGYGAARSCGYTGGGSQGHGRVERGEE